MNNAPVLQILLHSKKFSSVFKNADHECVRDVQALFVEIVRA
jgi:hypothetical protein